jgi:hypothetical protein
VLTGAVFLITFISDEVYLLFADLVGETAKLECMLDIFERSFSGILEDISGLGEGQVSLGTANKLP